MIQHTTLDIESSALAQELKETITFAKRCHNLNTLPDAATSLLAIAKLTVQSAAALDVYGTNRMAGERHSHSSRNRNLITITVAPINSEFMKSLRGRISDCSKRLEVSRRRLQDIITISILQGQNESVATSRGMI